MGNVLDQSYFLRPTCVVAADLVGKVLCRRLPERGGSHKVLRMCVTETEAYIGASDPACHTHAGTRTPRTEVMYSEGGVFYIYLTYGVHHMLNIVTSQAGSAEAVLIRAGFLLEDSEVLAEDALLPSGKQLRHIKALAGPGKLTKRLQITKALYGQPITPQSGLWLEDDGIVPPVCLRPRIGIDYAGDAKDWLLRYVWSDHDSLSKK